MILKFFVSTIGFWIANHLLQQIWHQFGFSIRSLYTTQLLVSVVMILFGVLTAQSILLHWLLIGIVLGTLKFFPNFFKLFIKRELQRSVIQWLDAVVISIQSGVSLRMAAVQAAYSFDGWKQNLFIELAQAIAFSEKANVGKWPSIANLAERVIEVERSGVQCLEQIKAIRREHAMLENFRRRSGQVTMQIKMQALIVTFLYIGLLFFVGHMFGLKQNMHIVFLSLTMFLTGLIWIFLIGRKIKWKT